MEALAPFSRPSLVRRPTLRHARLSFTRTALSCCTSALAGGRVRFIFDSPPALLVGAALPPQGGRVSPRLLISSMVAEPRARAPTQKSIVHISVTHAIIQVRGTNRSARSLLSKWGIRYTRRTSGGAQITCCPRRSSPGGYVETAHVLTLIIRSNKRKLISHSQATSFVYFTMPEKILKKHLRFFSRSSALKGAYRQVISGTSEKYSPRANFF